LRATKATKTAEGAAKMPKNPSVGHILQSLEVKNDFILSKNIFSTKNWAFYTKLK
jgi:hypothetical protein